MKWETGGGSCGEQRGDELSEEIYESGSGVAKHKANGEAKKVMREGIVGKDMEDWGLKVEMARGSNEQKWWRRPQNGSEH